MRFGLFGRLPQPLGGGRPRAQRIYESMRDHRGERYSRADGGDDNTSLRCAARAIAIAASYQQRGFNQAHVGLATDLLPEWEQRLGRHPDPSETPAQRRALGEAILAGSGPCEYDRIAFAVERAVGERPTIVAGTKLSKAHGPDVTYAPWAHALATTGSELRAGMHTIAVAFETDTAIRLADTTAADAVVSGGAIRLEPVPLATVAGALRVHVFMSVAPDSESLAWVATTTGEAITLYRYPRNPGTPELHHIAVVVGHATWADRVKRRKIYEVVGAMLPAWTTLAVVTESPFLLGETPLGKGAF